MFIFQPDRRLLRAFVAAHAPGFSGNVLDVGGGTRRYADLFRHCNYTILDPDEASKPNIVGTAEAIPLGDASVDGVVCTQVLGDVWDTRAAIAEMHRVLKPGGRLLITESLFNEEHDEPRDYWRFTQFAWKTLLGDGFDILLLEPRGGYHSQKLQNAIRHRIERDKLYANPLLGRLWNLWWSITGPRAIRRDACSRDAANKKFPIGYCILARKR